MFAKWESILDHAFKHVSKEVNVDGFRKGQVPKEIYIKKFGVAHLYDHAIDDALPVMLDKLLEDPETLRPACTPQVNLKSIDDKSIEVEFTIISMPEVKLGKYKSKDLGVNKKDVKAAVYRIVGEKVKVDYKEYRRYGIKKYAEHHHADGRAARTRY